MLCLVALHSEYSIFFAQQVEHLANNRSYGLGAFIWPRCVVCLIAQHLTRALRPQAASQLLCSTVWQVSTTQDLTPVPTSAAAGATGLRLQFCSQREAAGPCQPAFAAAAEVLQQLQPRGAAAQQGSRPMRLTVYDAGVAQTSARQVRQFASSSGRSYRRCICELCDVLIGTQMGSACRLAQAAHCTGNDVLCMPIDVFCRPCTAGDAHRVPTPLCRTRWYKQTSRQPQLRRWSGSRQLRRRLGPSARVMRRPPPSGQSTRQQSALHPQLTQSEMPAPRCWSRGY